jgi:hypothetical protein
MLKYSQRNKNMVEENKENPLKQPKVVISKRKLEEIEDAGGTSIRTQDINNTPSYMVKDQTHPGRLPKQEVPKTTNKN